MSRGLRLSLWVSVTAVYAVVLVAAFRDFPLAGVPWVSAGWVFFCWVRGTFE